MKSILVLLAFAPLFGCKPEHTDAEIYAASERVGFTHKQAIFLRHGPLWSQALCVDSEFSEKACSFFAAGDSDYHPDKEYYPACEASSLSALQCRLLRIGVTQFETERWDLGDLGQHQ